MLKQQPKGVYMKGNVSQSVKKIIAKECGLSSKLITNEMPFMANRELSYFDCIDVIYDLEHKYKVRLPESDFVKYDTVGALVKIVTAQLNKGSR